MKSDDKIMKQITLFDILTTWTDIINDIIHPKGRSVYDAFWKDDRCYYAGSSLIIISIGVLAGVVVQKIVKN